MPSSGLAATDYRASPTNRSAGQLIFGRAGRQLLPLLRSSQGGVQELREEARELGITMSREDTTAAAELTDAMNRVWRHVKQTSGAIAGPFHQVSRSDDESAGAGDQLDEGQGFLAIDNNASERALKRVALGRKNWLFAGNDAAAENAARLWSLIASCERHHVDPQRYLTSVLAKIGTTPHDQLEQFLPDVWGREDQAEPVPAE